MAILVVAETREHGLHPVSVEAIAAAGRFAGPVEVVVPGHDLEEACREASAYDVAGVTALGSSGPCVVHGRCVRQRARGFHLTAFA